MQRREIAVAMEARQKQQQKRGRQDKSRRHRLPCIAFRDKTLQRHRARRGRAAKAGKSWTLMLSVRAVCDRPRRTALVHGHG